VEVTDEMKYLGRNIFCHWKPNFKMLGLIRNWMQTQST